MRLDRSSSLPLSANSNNVIASKKRIELQTSLSSSTASESSHTNKIFESVMCTTIGRDDPLRCSFTTPSNGPREEDGKCQIHPFVQLKRLSPRTGRWKDLLDSCPLCVMDDRSVCGSVSGSVCSSVVAPQSVCNNPHVVSAVSGGDGNAGELGAARSKNPTTEVDAEITPDEDEAAVIATDRKLERTDDGTACCDKSDDPRSNSAPQQRSRSRSREPPSSSRRSRSISRVRFGEVRHSLNGDDPTSTDNSGLNGLSSLPGNLQHGATRLSSASSVVSTASTKSALKAPRYKACRVEMQRQLGKDNIHMMCAHTQNFFVYNIIHTC